MTSKTKSGSTRAGRSRGARRLRAMLVALLTTIGFAASGAASAQAAPHGRTDVCRSWGCASATFTWAGTNYLAPLSLSYADTGCDGLTVAFGLRMGYSDGTVHLTTPRKAGGCHDGYTVTNTSWTASKAINWVQGVLYYDWLGAHPKAYCGTRITRDGVKTGSPGGTC